MYRPCDIAIPAGAMARHIIESPIYDIDFLKIVCLAKLRGQPILKTIFLLLYIFIDGMKLLLLAEKCINSRVPKKGIKISFAYLLTIGLWGLLSDFNLMGITESCSAIQLTFEAFKGI